MRTITCILLLIVLTTCSSDEEIPKCGLQEWFSLPKNSCVPEGEPGARPFCRNVTYTLREFQALDEKIRTLENETEGDKVTVCYPFTAKFMLCRRWVLNQDEFDLEDDGRILNDHNAKRIYSTGEFMTRRFSSGLEAIVCVSEAALMNEDRLFKPIYLYSTAWVISALSLIFAFILCIAVPGLTTYRVVLPCYVGSLFVVYLVMLIRAFSPPPDSTLCFTYAVSLQFSFLSAFFWLNVIAFDIWRSVSSPLARPGHWRLIGYLTFGWGCPVLMVGTAIVLDKSRHFEFASAFRPYFQENCWFRGTPSIIAFFYGPIATVLALNVIFFILTILAVKSQVESSAVKKTPKIWLLSVELAVVMGFCWIMEVVSWAVGGDLSNWYFTDTINGLQGLFVLIIIARKRSVIRWLMRSIGKRSEKDDLEASTITYIQTNEKNNPPK